MKIASCLYKFQKIARKANISFDNIYHTLNIIDKPLYDVLEPYRSGWKSFFTLFANILNDTECIGTIFPNMVLVVDTSDYHDIIYNEDTIFNTTNQKFIKDIYNIFETNHDIVTSFVLQYPLLSFDFVILSEQIQQSHNVTNIRSWVSSITNFSDQIQRVCESYIDIIRNIKEDMTKLTETMDMIHKVFTVIATYPLLNVEDIRKCHISIQNTQKVYTCNNIACAYPTIGKKTCDKNPLCNVCTTVEKQISDIVTKHYITNHNEQRIGVETTISIISCLCVDMLCLNHMIK